MIVMFPMLTSTTISNDTFPYICKVLEKFVLLYRREAIASRLSLTNKASYAASAISGVATAGRKILRQGEEFDGEGEPLLEYRGKRNGDGDDDDDDQPTLFEPKMSPATAKAYKGLKGVSTNLKAVINMNKGEDKSFEFNSPRLESLALEPTWVELVHPNIGTIVLGVKVLPFPVSSEFNLLYYLSNDMSSNAMMGELLSRWRKYVRMAWTVLRTIPVVGGYLKKGITGDPQQDIIYASTTFKHNVFCMVNYNDAISQMIRNPGTLRKMYKLGWNSLVFADDINRRGIFCMNEFQGLCSTIPYSVMGASFGKDYKEVFQSLEDVKKATASFFSVKKTPESFFRENFTLNKYLDVMQGE